MSDSTSRLLPITSAEQETGLSKDLLRAWERRYGFPAPLRDAQGDRLYPPDQIRKLRLLSALTDRGERPAKLMALHEHELAARLAELREGDAGEDPAPDHPGSDWSDWLEPVAQARPELLEARLGTEVIRFGLERFAIEVAAPLCAAAGLAWERGELAIHQEHLFSQVMARCLRQNIARIAVHSAGAPSVLLTTVPGEMHELGLLMVEAVLTTHGLHCVNLGTQMPLDDVVAAAAAHACTVVALSFSSSFNARLAAKAVTDLRKALPADIRIWAGGANAGLRTRLPDGIEVFAGLAGIAPAIAALTGDRHAEDSGPEGRR